MAKLLEGLGALYPQRVDEGTDAHAPAGDRFSGPLVATGVAGDCDALAARWWPRAKLFVVGQDIEVRWSAYVQSWGVVNTNTHVKLCRDGVWRTSWQVSHEAEPGADRFADLVEVEAALGWWCMAEGPIGGNDGDAA